MNLVLIGYRGTGKTTVGRLLAARLDWTCLDADDEIERRAGRSIRAIFADEGEGAFRELEAEQLRRFALLDQQVLSLGGGAVVRDENRPIIQRLGRVVWLQAPADVLQRRIAADATSGERRPNLTVAGGLTEIERLLAVREPFYRECAEIAVDTNNKTSAEIADEILQRLHLPSDSAASQP